MKLKIFSSILLTSLLLSSCYTGKKALQKGNYADAVFKSIERLRSNPDNKKSKAILSDAYPLAIQTLEIEIEEVLATNDLNKFGVISTKYQTLNDMAKEIRRSPAALRIIPNPKTYTVQLTAAKDKAAEAFLSC